MAINKQNERKKNMYKNNREKKNIAILRTIFYSFKAIQPSLDHGHNPSDAH